MDQQFIRNFCIIAHIDHGKSTLADRLLQMTDTISARDMMSQVLDTMDLEREKGVTIKASAVRMRYTAADGQDYEMNLIDTPGHVDFAYEVSRALQACEGAVLVVDATQGVEAQTLANLYLAMENDLEVIPIVNKIDLVSAQPDVVAQEIEEVLGTPAEDVLRISAKEGTNIRALLEAVVQHVPPPHGQRGQSLRALIFDSHYDAYKGVIAYVRVVDGVVETGQTLRLMSTGLPVEPLEIGYFGPDMRPTSRLEAGEVGYIATGLKTVSDCGVGDTFTLNGAPADVPLHGYTPMKSMVFASAYPSEASDYISLREALEKLQLNDASLTFQVESSQALGYGFRCGFLGLFHMEIVQERLEREYDLDLVFTAPSVEYEVTKTDGSEILIDSPVELPDPTLIAEIREPWIQIDVFTPTEFIGQVMDLVTGRRGEFKAQEYLDARRGPAQLSHPAGGNPDRLLQRAQGAHARLRQPGLSPGGLPPGRHGAARRAGEQGAGRRAQHDRASGADLHQGDEARQQAERCHPAPAVRRADPGRGGEQGRQPGKREGDEERCPGEMLRWRYIPKTQTS